MKKNITFSFQGVNGAYSELAGKNLYSESESIPCKTFEEMFEAVHKNKADIALVPIENSKAGRVADTQRLIPESNLKIIGEYFLEVNHCLLAVKGAKIENIIRIHSHEQAIAQCRKNIIKNKKDMVVAADTAGAAKMISSLNKKGAWKDKTAVHYFTKLWPMEASLSARVPLPWVQFIEDFIKTTWRV